MYENAKLQNGTAVAPSLIMCRVREKTQNTTLRKSHSRLLRCYSGETATKTKLSAFNVFVFPVGPFFIGAALICFRNRHDVMGDFMQMIFVEYGMRFASQSIKMHLLRQMFLKKSVD